MPAPPASQRLIGYWIKHADALLTTRIEEAHRASGMTRVEWQVLNTLHETGHADPPRLAEALRPFADAEAVERCLIRLEEQNMVAEGGAGGYTLTAEGERLYAEALARQDALRAEAMQGISEDAYRTTLGVLRRLVENLDPNA